MINNLTSSSLGGGYQGIAPPPSLNYQRTREDVMNRRKLVNAMNKAGMQKSINGYGRVSTPFRSAWGTEDYLTRLYYVDGTQPNEISGRTFNGSVIRGTLGGSAISNKDGTGVQATGGNGDKVATGADYSNFVKLMAINSTFNATKLH